MGKRSVKWLAVILLMTVITVCCLGRGIVSTRMQMKADGHVPERGGRPADTEDEEVKKVNDSGSQMVESTEDNAGINEKETDRLKAEISDGTGMALKVNFQTEDANVKEKTEVSDENSNEAHTDHHREQSEEKSTEQRTEVRTEARTEQRTEQRTESRTEQRVEEHTEQRTETRTEQRTEEHTEQRTEERTEQPGAEQNTGTPACSHNWVWMTHTETVHHDAVYEEYLVCEAYDENVYESHSFCNNCGIDLTVNFGGGTTGEALDHMLNVCGGCGYHSGRAVVGTIHHDAEYGTICTALAYDEEVEVKDYEYCSVCGTRR